MKTAEVNGSIIGKRCKCIFTGLMVTGVIEDTKITQHTAEVKVRFDEPHQWGNKRFKYDWAYARLHDEFGSLHHLEIIDDKYQTIVVEFNKEIAEIDRMFAQNYSILGAVNLKEWIDNYESSRFTKFSRDTAIITSEYNMENLIKWLNEQDYIKEYQYITK